jgi:hypothetical protein
MCYFFVQTHYRQQNASAANKQASKHLFDVLGGDNLCVFITSIILNPRSMSPESNLDSM